MINKQGGQVMMIPNFIIVQNLMSFPIPFNKNYRGSRYKKNYGSGVGEKSFDHEPIKSEIQIQLILKNG